MLRPFLLIEAFASEDLHNLSAKVADVIDHVMEPKNLVHDGGTPDDSNGDQSGYLPEAHGRDESQAKLHKTVLQMYEDGEIHESAVQRDGGNNAHGIEGHLDHEEYSDHYKNYDSVVIESPPSVEQHGHEDWRQHMPHGDVDAADEYFEDYGEWSEHHKFDDYEPPLANHSWITVWLSYAHSSCNNLMYLLLLWMVISDRAAIGVSYQTMLAFFVSECLILSMTFINATMIIRVMPPKSFFLIDVPAILLSGCALSAIGRFWTRYEDEHDAFGLNLANYVLFYCSAGRFYNSVGIEGGQHANMAAITPSGKLGKLVRRSYYLAFYFIALVMAAIFYNIRVRLYSGYEMTAFHQFHEGTISLIDAVRGIALIPQLYMFSTTKKPIVTSHLRLFVVFEFFGRMTALTYWITLPLFYPAFGMVMRNYNVIVHTGNAAVIATCAAYYLFSDASGKVRSPRDFELPGLKPSNTNRAHRVS